MEIARKFRLGGRRGLLRSAREVARVAQTLVDQDRPLLVHIVPMTVGFINWVTLQMLGRRVYRDHYESDASLRASREASRSLPEKAA